MSSRSATKFALPLSDQHASFGEPLIIPAKPAIERAVDGGDRTLLTYEDVASQIIVSVRTVQRYVEQGYLVAIKLPHGVRFRQSDVDAFIDNRRG